MMKRGLALLVSLLLLLALLPSAALAAVSGFTDVPEDAYYAEAVRWAVAEGVTNGTSPTTFSPDSTVTRGQAVTFLWRAMGRPEPSAGNCPFRDVAQGEYYFKPILWAVERGITNGTSADAFSPDQTCSRAHILTFLYRTVGEPGKTGTGAWYDDAMTWADGAGLTRALDSSAPAADCPRADVVCYLWKYGGQAAVDSLADALIDPTASVRHDNGDIVFAGLDGLLTDDSGTSFPYYRQLITVYLWERPSAETLRRLPALVDGELVSYLNGAIRVLEIRVDADERTELEAMAQTLTADAEVMHAGLSIVAPAEKSTVSPGLAPDDKTPWDGEGTERGNETNPGGNDWWAELIGAYTAWQYEGLSKPTLAGIVDSGFQMTHRELVGRMIAVPGYAIGEAGGHGTATASILAAAKNEYGLRGVADKATLICFNYSETGDLPLRSLDYLEAYQQMIEMGASVINNSYGMNRASLLRYLQDKDAEARERGETGNLEYLYLHGDDATRDRILSIYQQYILNCADLAKLTALNSLWMITQMIQSGTDCLFVQSAGNGFSGSNITYEASQNGWFASITEALFSDCFSDAESQAMLRKYGISYSSVQERIMVVGGVDRSRHMTEKSCYGDAVTIAAPGGTQQMPIYCANVSNGYQRQFGTSLAAPMVAGSAVLLKSMDPELTAPEIRGILLQTAGMAYGTGSDGDSTYKLLRVGEAVRSIAGLLKIKVLDEDDKPIEDAEITVTDRAGHVLTARPVYDGDGKTLLYYTVPALKDKDGSVCRIRIEAEGREPLSEKLTVTGDAELEYVMADGYERDRKIYTEYLLNGGYEEIIEVNGWLNRSGVKSSKTVVNSCLADLDGDGVHELLIRLEDRSYDGVRGWHTVSAVLGIDDDGAVRILLTAFNGGGSMGGEFLRLAYDNAEERYYPVVTAWYQEMAGAHAIRTDAVWTGSAVSYSVGFDLAMERVALTGNSVTDQYLLQRINTVKSQTALYEYVTENGSSVFCCYTLDGAFISRAQYDAYVRSYPGLGDYSEPSDPDYQYRTCTWRVPIAPRENS